MYNIFRESILAPKQLIKYHKKSGWFVFLYIFILAVILSIDVFVILIANDNPIVNNETTGCEVVDGNFVCDATPLEDQYFSIYDIPVYFLSEGQEIDDVVIDDMDNVIFMPMAIAVKDDTIHYLFDAPISTSLNAGEFDSVSALYSNIKGSVISLAIVKTILQNMMVMIFIILISTIPFLRFRKEIRYKKIFKMVTFASTPIALMLLITSLLNLDMIFFFIFLFIAYRSVFSLQKELYVRSMMRQQSHSQRQTPNEDDVIDQEEDDD